MAVCYAVLHCRYTVAANIAIRFTDGRRFIELSRENSLWVSAPMRRFPLGDLIVFLLPICNRDTATDSITGNTGTEEAISVSNGAEIGECVRLGSNPFWPSRHSNI